MKKSGSKKGKAMNISLIRIVWCILVLLFYSTANSSDQRVQEAYQLRMNGQADTAKTLLEKAATENPADAAIWFELARTKHHIGLGNPRQLFAGLGDLHNSIQRAVELQPDNPIYGFYNGNICFTVAYASMKRNQPDAKEKMGAVFTAYESLLQLKPDYKEAMLFLVEALSVPEEMGGNLLKAQMYADKLQKLDPVYGAKARELVLPAEADRVEFWKKVQAENADNAAITEQLGKAYLYQGQITEGERCLEKAMQMDSDKSILLMDLARFYLMQSHQDTALAKISLPKADQKIDQFLNTNPIQLLRAFALNMQAGIKQMRGFTSEADSLKLEANKLDPNVSKAFGIPPAILFDKPDEISHYHGYFFRPL